MRVSKMQKFTIHRATKKKAKLRLALVGPAGAGKTYTALTTAFGLVPGGRVVIIDTEHGSSEKCAGEFPQFDVLPLEHHGLEIYQAAIEHCESEGYDVIIVDSLSHAWMGADGALEQVDKAATRANGNSFVGWRDVTPKHNALMEKVISCKAHLIATMRTKTEWVMEKNSRGKMEPRKVGLSPVQRAGVEYLFDVIGNLNTEHVMVIDKTRCSVIADEVFTKPDGQFGETLQGWLNDGSDEASPIVSEAEVRVGSEGRQVANGEIRHNWAQEAGGIFNQRGVTDQVEKRALLFEVLGMDGDPNEPFTLTQEVAQRFVESIRAQEQAAAEGASTL